MACLICSGGTRGRCWRAWPGCPPRWRPEEGLGGRRLTWGGSLDGGRDELVEFWLSRCRRSSTCCWRACDRCSYCWTRAKIAAWAAGGTWFQSSTGIGGTGGIPTFYGRWSPGQVQAVNGYFFVKCLPRPGEDFGRYPFAGESFGRVGLIG